MNGRDFRRIKNTFYCIPCNFNGNVRVIESDGLLIPLRWSSESKELEDDIIKVLVKHGLMQEGDTYEDIQEL